MVKFESNSPGQTRTLAKNFGTQLKGRELLALYGPLGSGKTTFVQGLARGLKIKNRMVSPTFVIMNRCIIPGKIKKYFYHFDLYRLGRSRDLTELGFEEILQDARNIVAIEWPEKAGALLPSRAIRIKFTHDPKYPTKRIITFS